MHTDIWKPSKFPPPSPCITPQGYFTGDEFHPIPEGYLKAGRDILAQIFRDQVIGLLMDKNLLSLELARNILTWKHNSGFSVHCDVSIQAGDRAGMERLARYIMRNPVSLERIITGKGGVVCYRLVIFA